MLDTVLYCRLPNFYVTLLDLSPARPAAVIRNNTVLDANALAIKRGVVPGMPLAQARTILREDGLFRTLLPEEGEQEQKAWLDLAARHTGVIEPEDRHSAYLDLSAHPKPIDVACRFLERLARLTGCEAEFGVGPSKWLARLSADVCGDRLTPLDLQPLPTQNLTPVSPEHRERLRFLGYHTIGLVAELPISILRGQFGDDGLRIKLAAAGSWKEPVHPLYPPDALTERLFLDGASNDTLIQDQALVSLAQRIGRRLLKAEQQATELRLTLEKEDGTLHLLTRRFNKPLRCPRTTISALRLLFAQGIPEPIASFCIHLPQLDPVRCTQQNLMGALNKSEANHLAENALRQVRSVFGETSIQLAGKVAVSRRIRVLQEWKNATGWR